MFNFKYHAPCDNTKGSVLPLIRATSVSPYKNVIRMQKTEIPNPRIKALAIPRLIRSVLPAPRFWLENVAEAMESGAKTTISVSSILRAVVCAATVAGPKLLTANCSEIEPMDTIENISAIDAALPDKSRVSSRFAGVDAKCSLEGRMSRHFQTR